MWGMEIIKQSNKASQNLEWLNRTCSSYAALGWNILQVLNYYGCEKFKKKKKKILIIGNWRI